MDRGTIVEVNSWDMNGWDNTRFDEMRAQGAGGVVIKASQGIDWTFSRLPELIRRARMDGLLVGVLHYAEPGRNDAEVEAEHLMNSLPDDDLPLGVWCELDDLGGKLAHEVGPWVETWTQHAMTPLARPVILCSAELFSQMAGAPWAARWVATSKGEGSTVPWATRGGWDNGSDEAGAPDPLVTYQLTTTRGLNAPESGSRVGSPPAVATAPQGDTEAPQADDLPGDADALADQGLDAPE